MANNWSVYVIETDKHIQNDWNEVTVYVGMSSLSPKDRFVQHQNGIKSYMARYGKPIKLIETFCVEKIPNRELANDIERLIWNKLKMSSNFRTVQRYAPKLQGRNKYSDDYQNYKD